MLLPILEKTQGILLEENLDLLAIESGYKKRESKITPKMFLDNLMHNASSDVNKSLNSLSIDMKQNYNVVVSKQGLNERYTQEASLYLKSVLGQFCFASAMPIDEGWLGHFNSVRIKDSTKFVLPEEYANVMPGFGGVSSKSATGIQYEYDLKTGSILDLNITAANRTDSKDARDTQDNIKPNDLVIRDLGYYSLDVISKFMEVGAFIISKLNTNTFVYEKENNKYKLIEFGKLYSWMKKHKLQQIDKQVYIGSEAKMPFRLIINIVPDEVFAKRMQKVNKYNKRMGHTTSDEYTDRARFNLIITNIPCTTIPTQAIIALYHVRWQIELVFKIWKSTFGIHKIGKMKYYRWLCILYAKLILIAIYWQTIMTTRSVFYKTKGKLLSTDKCFKSLKTETHKLRDAIRKGNQSILQLMEYLIELISEKHWLEKKKNKLNFEQIMYLYYCKSDIYVYI
jgi:hypothetical protein